MGWMAIRNKTIFRKVKTKHRWLACNIPKVVRKKDRKKLQQIFQGRDKNSINLRRRNRSTNTKKVLNGKQRWREKKEMKQKTDE